MEGELSTWWSHRSADVEYNADNRSAGLVGPPLTSTHGKCLPYTSSRCSAVLTQACTQGEGYGVRGVGLRGKMCVCVGGGGRGGEGGGRRKRTGTVAAACGRAALHTAKAFKSYAYAPDRSGHTLLWSHPTSLHVEDVEGRQQRWAGGLTAGATTPCWAWLAVLRNSSKRAVR